MANQLGKRYLCSKCGSEFIVTRGGDGILNCCGQPMELKQKKQKGTVLLMANKLGKRYECASCGTEILCTKEGSGEVICCNAPVPEQKAEALPSSDQGFMTALVC